MSFSSANAAAPPPPSAGDDAISFESSENALRLHELYQEHSSSLVRQLTRGTGCRDLARDRVQETFLRLLRMAPASLAGIKHPESYLRRASTNLLRTRRKMEAFREETLPGPVAADPLTEDVEFYHDTTGLTRSRDAVVQSMMRGPCGTPGLHMRREPVASSVKFNAVPGFGAILVGQHLFYERQGDGPEKPATLASFMVVWKLQSDRWLMTRIVSYDHQPVPYSPTSARIALPLKDLEGYVGTYHTASSGDIDITLESGTLKLHSGGLRVTLAASAPNRFFALERDLKFSFSEKPDSFEITVEENGATVATGTRIKSPR